MDEAKYFSFLDESLLEAVADLRLGVGIKLQARQPY